MRWATRAGVHIDRAACAWLIRRHVDLDAGALLGAADRVRRLRDPRRRRVDRRPPDGPAETLDPDAERFCLQLCPVGSSMRSLSIVAVLVMSLSYRTAMLITR